MSVTLPSHVLTLDQWAALEQTTEYTIELVAGVVHVPPGPTVLHQMLVKRIAALLDTQLPEGWATVTEVDVVLDPSELATVRAPDVVVIPTAFAWSGARRLTAADVAVVVEVVSPGSGRTDRHLKSVEYAQAGIGTYWLIGVDGASADLYGLRGGVYEPAPLAAVLDGVRVALDVHALRLP
ncbi:Uma2 family endonuclease [Cellulomonas sp. NPDC057328]|uniref:Uma2 family endonuclease n=1 Tax=Cellulomonas sp. NPDC057328 TaxID=3346101 RepID=UPI0036388B7A